MHPEMGAESEGLLSLPPAKPTGSFFYFFYMLFEFIYMAHYFSEKTLKDEQIYTYELMDGIRREAKIYSSGRRTNKKIILFLSGSYNLCYDIYIRKVVADLQKRREIVDEYELMTIEKFNQSSIVMYDDVAMFLNTLDLEELVIFGFSSGGVVASHIMARLNSRTMKKKIITYDTPWQVQDNVESFAKNVFYRIDMLFFRIVHSIYSNHYNSDELQHHLVTTSYFHGAERMVSMIKAIHNYSDREMYRVTGWNWEVPADLKVVNIFCTSDPFVNRSTHTRFLAIYGHLAKFTTVDLKKDIIGHCSDMGYGTAYLKEVMAALTM